MIDYNDSDWWRFAEKIIRKFTLAGLYCPYDDMPSADCHWEAGSDWRTLAIDYKRAEQPFRKEIESCSRFVTENWDSEFDLENSGNLASPEARYFITLRIEAIVWFLHSMRGLFYTLIPFPNSVSEAEFAQWIATDWFRFHGPTVVVMMRCSPVFRVSGDKQELIEFLKKEVPGFPDFLRNRLRSFKTRQAIAAEGAGQ